MVDVVTPSESFGDSCDVLHANDGVGDRLACDGIPDHSLDTGMNLKRKKGTFKKPLVFMKMLFFLLGQIETYLEQSKSRKRWENILFHLTSVKLKFD